MHPEQRMKKLIKMSTVVDGKESSKDTSFFGDVIQFPIVIDQAIDTKDFLDASAGVVELLDKFGKIFGVVKYDINGNIEKIKRTYNNNPEENGTLQQLVLNERAKGEIIAIDALMWLRRGLHYFSRFLEGLVNEDTEDCDISTILRTAYHDTLQQYHGWLAQRLFNLLCKISPKRNDLIKLTCNTATKEQLYCDIKNYNINLSLCINALYQFYISNNLEVLGRV